MTAPIAATRSAKWPARSQVFLATSLERQKLNREARLLSQLNEWLQSCKSLDELYQMVAEFLSRLLPDCAGSLYIYANSRDVLDSAKAWNGGQTTTAMHPDDCWGLRRGRTYTFGENEIDFPCAHVGATSRPLLLHSDPRARRDHRLAPPRLWARCRRKAGHARRIAEQRRLALVCAEQISLAIANAKLRDQLRDQSIRDALTGMYNRRYMLETCRREFSRAARAAQSVSILSIDIDHFKKFNDNHGHDAGDTVLRAVSDCLKANFRDEDVACRFGGEEFVVILPGTVPRLPSPRPTRFAPRSKLLWCATSMPTCRASPSRSASPHFRTPATIAQAVLKAADEALYRAKDGGRNRVELSATVASSNTTSSVVNMQRALAVGGSREQPARDLERGADAA